MLIIISIIVIFVLLICLYDFVGYSARVPVLVNFFRKSNTKNKLVALTFDDGPTLPYSKYILDCLDSENVKGTFFMVGKQIEKHPGFVIDVINRGHEIGNHSYSHQSLINRKMKFVEFEVMRTEEIMGSMNIVSSGLFRPPYGHQRFCLSYILNRNKLKNILWSVDSLDYCTKDPDDIVRNVVQDIHAGAVVLMHDGGGDRTETCAALPLIISGLKSKGYSFKTISELRMAE